MKVEIINPEVVENLYRNHGTFACVCYDTPDKYADKVGKSCEEDGHMSGSRCEYIKFKVSGLDRGTSEQCLRHEIGTAIPHDMQDNYTFSEYSELVKDVSPDQIVKNMASFRYIDKDGFKWSTPKTIMNCPKAKELYVPVYFDGVNCWVSSMTIAARSRPLWRNLVSSPSVLPRTQTSFFPEPLKLSL